MRRIEFLIIALALAAFGCEETPDTVNTDGTAEASADALLGVPDVPDDRAVDVALDATGDVSDVTGDVPDASSEEPSDVLDEANDAPSDRAQDDVFDVPGDDSETRDGAAPDVSETPDAPDTSACSAGQTRCGDACLDLQTDPAHCGSCDGTCRTLPGVNSVTITCERGGCTVHDHCAVGFSDCDGIASNGCESDLSRPASCGSCGTVCSGATSACTAVTGDGGVVARVCAVPLPPDPATVAPPLDRTVTTTLDRASAFLYTGTNPIQTGVAPGTINPVHVTVLRGKVLDRAGAAMSGVTITISGHPEFGQTLTRVDGMFDMAANGGGFLTVNYARNGYLTVQRQVQTRASASILM